MKRVMKKFNRALSIMLVAAMVLTMAPQTAMPVLAAENDVVNTTVDEPAAPVVEEPASGASDEQTEPAEEDNGTPVIEDENEPADPPAETPSEEPTETPEEPVVTPEEPVEEEPVVTPEEPVVTPEEPVEEIGSSIMSVETIQSVTDCKAEEPTGTGFTAELTSGVDKANGNKLKDGEDLVLTITQSTGYIVKSASWSIGGTEQTGENAGTFTEVADSDPKKYTYTIPAAKLTETLASAAADTTITFTVTAVQTFDVTVTVDTTANIQTLASVIGGTETAINPVNASNTVTVETGTALSLKVVPADNYEATVTVGGTAKTDTNNVYEIGPITAATTVAITTAEIVNSYAVTETIKANGAAQSGDAAKALATIEYTANCVSTDADTQAKSIAKGTDLTFKVNEVPGADGAPGSFDGKVVEVSYTIAGGGEKPLTKDANGVYKVEKDAITGAVAIIVNVRNLAEVTVGFGGVDTDTIKLSYKVADAADFVELTDNTLSTVKVQEGKTFSFKVEPKDVYRIDKVTVKHGSNDAVKLDATDGVYSFVATQDIPVITVETSYDDTKVNSLAFKVDGDADSYSVISTNITDDSGNPIDDLKAGDYEIGDKLLTKAAKLKVTLTPDASYDITKVALGTDILYDASKAEDAEKDPVGPYAIDFGASVSAKELTVTTKAKTFENDVQVTFSIAELAKTNVDYTVVTSDTVVKDKAEGAYTIKKGEAYLKFDVTTVGKYKPVVQVNGADTLAIPEKKEGKYSYRYLVAKLNEGAPNTITIGVESDIKSVNFVYDEAQVDVSATQGNTALQPVNKQYNVKDGDTISFKVAAKDNFVIEKVTTKGAAADAEATEVTLTNGRFNLTVEEDTTVTITSKGVLSQKELIDKATGEAPAKDKSGAYVVSNTGTYVGGAVEGSADVAIDSVKLFDSKNKEVAMTTGEGEAAVTNWSANANKTEITLFPTTAIAGQKLTLKMFQQVTKKDAEGNVVKDEQNNPVKEDVEVAVYKLAVSAKLDATKVKVSDIKQATDTRAEYPVTVNAGAEVSKIKMDLTDTDAAVVKKDATTFVNGKLTVTTGFKAGATTIKLYVLTNEAQPDAAANRTVVKEVPVTTTALIDKDATKAPKISLASATDVSLTLALDASALKLKNAETGDIYYEIHAVANGEVPKNGSTELLKKDVYKYVKKTADKQNATLWLNASGDQDTSAYGTGGHCKYDVTVRLVHLKDKTDKAAQTTAITAADLAVESGYSASATTGTKPYETKAPYYEDNLKLKKGTTTVYTTQREVVIATPQFGKNTSYMVVDEDYCRDLSVSGRGALTISVDPETNAVLATANTNTTLGKHNIEVVAISTNEGDEGVPTMYASRATVAVTVVRGIEQLAVTVPSDTLFKDPSPKKTATMTAAVTYNNGVTSKAPKTKKVEWALLNKDNEVLSADDYLNGKLTIKGGKVTLAKDYVVSRTAADNQFKIAAIAADFNRNVDYKTPGSELVASAGKVAISRTITITNDAMSIGSLAILDGQNKVIARDGDTLEASQADGAKLVAFIPGAPEKAAYTADDLATYAANASNVKFTSGNAKAIIVYTSGVLSVVKPAKNVVLTATPGDGNPDRNAKKSMKLTVNYDTTGELGLRIFKIEPDDRAYEISDPDNKTPEFTDSTVARFGLLVQQKNSDNEWENVANDVNFTNYKLAVKGGKILYNSGDGTAEIATASAVTTITLTNSNVKPAVSTVYTLTNKGISGLAKGTKAPKVTIKDKLRADYPYDQQLKVQLSNTVKEDKPEYIKDFSKLYVKVDFDWTTFNVKKPGAQNIFQEQMNPKGYAQVNKDGSFYLDFEYLGYDLVAGSYKIKINFGEINEDGNFKSVAPAVAATIKVDKSKKLSFKPTTSYSISATDNGYAVLTGKGTYDYVTFGQLQNANIKGKENKFSRYFKIVDDTDANGNYVQKIMLTENYYTDVNDANIKLDFSDKKFKDDLTGYVSYTAYDAAYNTVSGTVKLTLKVSAPTAALTKYSLSTSGVIGTAAGSKVRIYVVDNKKNPVDMTGVLYGDNKNNPVWTCGFYGNEVTLTARAALTEPKYEIPITFLPEDSYYAAEYEKVKNDATKSVEFIQKYGITLTAKVSAKDLATVNKGRIKVDAKKLSQTFVPYLFDGTNYYTYVNYDEVYAGTVINKITNNSLKVGSGDSAPQLIKIERVGEYNTFKISMSKALFNQAIAADVKADGKSKNTFYDAKGKAKTLSVKADVCYNAEGTQKDTFTFKLTMPANRSAYTDQGEGGLTSYEQAIDAINQNKKAIADKVTVHYDYENVDWDVLGAQWDLYQEIVKAVGFDSGINFDVCEDDEDYAGVQKISEMLKPGVVVPSTTTTNGSLPIKATLKSLDASPKTEIIEFTLTIPKLRTDPSDVSSGVSAFIAANTAKYAVNTVTEADMISDLRAYMKTWAAEQDPVIDLTDIRFRIEDFVVVEAKFDEAGDPQPGSVTGKVVIWNIHLDEAYNQEVGIDYTIAAPVASNAVIDTVKAALGIGTETDGANDAAIIAELAVANTVDGVKADVLSVAQKAAGFAYTVEYQKDGSNEKFAFTPVTATTAGKLSFTLVVKDGDGNYIGEEKNAEGTVTTPATTIALAETTFAADANIMTVAEAEPLVTAWVAKATGESATDADKAVLTGSATAEAAATAIATAAGVKSTVTVTVTDFENVEATYNEDGHVSGTVVLSKGGSTNKKEAKVDFELIIPATGAWTMDNAEAAVKAAVANANIYISNTNVKTDAGKEAVAAQMLKAAQAAVPETKFTVAIKQEGDPLADVKLVVTDATTAQAGKVTLALVLTQVLASDAAEGTQPQKKDVTVEHAIPQLPEGSGSSDPETVAITDTLKTAIINAVNAKITDETAPVEIKADTQWDAISEDILNAANGASGVSPNFEVVAGTTPLQITSDATINLVVQQKNKPANKADIAITGITLTVDTPSGP